MRQVDGIAATGYTELSMRLNQAINLLLAGKLAFCFCAAPMATVATAEPEHRSCHSNQESEEGNPQKDDDGSRGCCCVVAAASTSPDIGFVRSEIIVSIAVSPKLFESNFHRKLAYSGNDPPDPLASSPFSTRAPPVLS